MIMNLSITVQNAWKASKLVSEERFFLLLKPGAKNSAAIEVVNPANDPKDGKPNFKFNVGRGNFSQKKCVRYLHWVSFRRRFIASVAAKNKQCASVIVFDFDISKEWEVGNIF